MHKHIARLTAALAVTAVLGSTGCASFHSYRQAQRAEAVGDHDLAVLKYMEALAAEPDNVSYRSGLLRAKIAASQAHFEKGKDYREARLLDRALIEFQQAVELDPSNQYAEVELAKTRGDLEAARSQRPSPASMDEMKRRASGARPQPPVLEPRSDQPISLDFPKPVSVLDIYRALGKAFGINVLFDPDLKASQELAIELKDVTAQAALETVMRAAGHFYKVIDEHTVLLAPDNAQKRRIYEDQVIQNFFLSNVEVKDAMTMLRSLVDARKVAPNEQLNAIMMRDTADKVKVAERLIQSVDKSKSEVVVDVELLQINTTRLRELGMSLNPYRIQQSIDMGTEDNTVHLSDLEFLNQANWALTIPTFIYDFVKQQGDAQLLAKPQLRISEGKKARLHIGDRVPIPVTTFNTAQTIGGNIVPITSFQYQDVGIKIDIEPRVHHNKEVTLKLTVEVSNIASFVDAGGGQRQPIIGTRNIESTIRLKDGETNFLAGLIRTDSANSESGIPGLSEIPVLGRLFSKTTNNNQRTDLILTLTPHIIRTPDVTQEDLMPIWVGTEANITFRGGSPRAESDVEGPFEEEATPEEVQEMIRRRVQQLPRGLTPQEAAAAPEQPETAPPPPGVQLAPATPPTDIFEPPPPPPAEEEEEEPPPGAGPVGFSGADDAPEALAQAAMLAEAGASPAGAEPPAVRLTLRPQRTRVGVGETVEVAILVVAGRPVSHLPLALQFDPQALAVERVDSGDFLGGPGDAQVLADASRPGELLLAGSRLGDLPGIAGSGVLARLQVRPLAAGEVKLSFLVGQALDKELKAVGPVATGALLLKVGEEGAPEPPRPPREKGVDG
jgi:general secretion pathway protein D